MKTSILLIVIALSINAFAQDSKPNTGILHHNTLSFENNDFRINNDRLPLSGINSNKFMENNIKHQDFAQQSLIRKNDSIYFWKWDTLINGRRINSKEINFCYDANNNEISSLLLKWDGSTWVNYWRYYSTIDVSNKLTNVLTQNWNGNDWINYMQTKITYDVENNATSYVYQIWDGNAWMNSSQVKFTYDANNRGSIELFQKWNVSGWLNDSQRIYTYDAMGINTSQLNQFWAGGVWNNGYNVILTYDANNNNIGDIVQYWYATYWKDVGQSIVSYDANNNKTRNLSQKWDGSTWVNDYQRTYTYDTNNFRTSYTFTDWNDASKITRNDSTAYYYHTVITGINDLKIRGENVSIYPNPCNGRFTISSENNISTIEIYNLSGKLICSNYNVNHQTSEEVYLSGFAKGIYFLKIFDGTICFNRKVIVK
ncbi:MAG: T9SS type A sorting domain-containing protein [Bacteroidales bacterium]|nr:T9SS type A sorting domain-containing protein [Bacteroidales bacterium]